MQNNKMGRNDVCPCGSGKKYKRCCMDSLSKLHSDIAEDVSHTLTMSPELSIDELNLVLQHKMEARNQQPMADFCGLTPMQMGNWLYSPFDELTGLKITTPTDLSMSPVMRYLALILDEMLVHGGSIKTTAKGNLPAKLVHQASELLPEFNETQDHEHPSISEFTGINEDKFNALHYTRILAELTKIIYVKAGRLHFKKSAQVQYQQQGISAFFLPMLETAIFKYNWGYFDGWPDDIEIRTFWLFMLWRLQQHHSLEQLIDEVAVAFPDLLLQLPDRQYASPIQLLGSLIQSRFVDRFLEFWGVVTVAPMRLSEDNKIESKMTIQPLLTQTFTFNIKH